MGSFPVRTQIFCVTFATRWFITHNKEQEKGSILRVWELALSLVGFSTSFCLLLWQCSFHWIIIDRVINRILYGISVSVTLWNRQKQPFCCQGPDDWVHVGGIVSDCGYIAAVEMTINVHQNLHQWIACAISMLLWVMQHTYIHWIWLHRALYYLC